MNEQTPFSTTIASFSAALRVAKVIARDLEELVRRRKAELAEIGDFERATAASYQQQEEQAHLEAEAPHQQAKANLRERVVELERKPATFEAGKPKQAHYLITVAHILVRVTIAVVDALPF